MQKVFRIIVGLCLLATVGLSSCLKGPEYAIEPHITNVTIDKTVIANFEESFIISIDFEDGDGDLGTDSDASEEELTDNIFLVDNRLNVGLDSIFTRPFSVETLTPSSGSQAIDGTIQVTITGLCCYNESGAPACFPNDARVETNEVVFDVYIEDRAGNQSNVMQTPPLTIQCK